MESYLVIFINSFNRANAELSNFSIDLMNSEELDSASVRNFSIVSNRYNKTLPKRFKIISPLRNY